MAVSFKGKGVPTPDGRTTDTTDNAPDKAVLQQFEVFGRLNVQLTTIAQFLNVSKPTAYNLMRRTDVRRAYERGRAEVTLAVRQKQLEAALKGSERMLLHAGVHFAEQEEAAENAAQAVSGVARDRTWGAELAKRAMEIRDRVTNAG